MQAELTQIGLSTGLVSVFEKLSESIESGETLSQEDLRQAFLKVFRCADASRAKDVVFIWTVDRPYTHHPTAHQSKFVYIEKTVGTISSRWRNAYVGRICRDKNGIELDRTAPDLRLFADADLNLTFYGRLIREHGPFTIWWASCKALNEASGLKFENSEAWERHLLGLYKRHFGCRPLKNRRGGRVLF